MDSIKHYLNEMDQEMDIDKLNRLNNQIDNEDQVIIKNLIEELVLKIENQAKEPVKKRINDDEILISSDESSDEMDISDYKPNSDDESCDLDSCLIRFKPLKTKGEILIEELPAPKEEDIQLTNASINELQQIGNVCKILSNLVIVESFKNLPALDLDSILFFRNGNSIGRVFDVIGPVRKPYYIIRFADQSTQFRSIFVNMPCYFVPNLVLNDLTVTKYVLISQLKNFKGSDASWEHNNEPPENVKEYSDDEEERQEQLKLKSKRKLDRNNKLIINSKKFSRTLQNKFTI